MRRADRSSQPAATTVGAGLLLGPRGGAEFPKQLSHPGVRLVAVGDESGLGLLVEVPGESLAVLHAQTTGLDRLLEHLRGRKARAVGFLEGLEAVHVDLEARLVGDGERTGGA